MGAAVGAMRRASAEALQPDGRDSARAANLRYVSDRRPGTTRARRGRSFRYVDRDGIPIRDSAERRRIEALAIPPAWTHVWICPDPNGHIQATGRDARGRKQYRYHARWRETRDETKYHRMIAFAEALPGIRRRVARDLARPGITREKVLATTVRLLETSHIRVGNEEYARRNGHYGLTTLRQDHVEVEGSTVHFHFAGKSGKVHDVDVRDRRLAKVIRRCQALPGQDLFQYTDADGLCHSIDSSAVNDYLREISGQDFTAKDFRTWSGTVQAFLELEGRELCAGSATAKSHVTEAIKAVAEQLGNTPAVCRKCYVHPSIIEDYLDRAADPAPARPAGQEIRSEPSESASAITGLTAAEERVLECLRRRA